MENRARFLPKLADNRPTSVRHPIDDFRWGVASRRRLVYGLIVLTTMTRRMTIDRSPLTNGRRWRAKRSLTERWNINVYVDIHEDGVEVGDNIYCPGKLVLLSCGRGGISQPPGRRHWPMKHLKYSSGHTFSCDKPNNEFSSLTDSLTHSLTYWHKQSFTHSLAHSFACWIKNALTHTNYLR